MTVLVTARLKLVPFDVGHVAGLNVMNADPQVMRYLAGRQETLEETAAMVERVKRRWVEFGYSWWSFVERQSGEIVGAGAIQNLRRDATPDPDPACPLEIGWRLRRDCWHRGFATEAAQTMAAFAFDTVGTEELYAVCHPDNVASAQVMKRLGMQDRGLQTWYGKRVATWQISAEQWRAARESSTPPDRVNEGSTGPTP